MVARRGGSNSNLKSGQDSLDRLTNEVQRHTSSDPMDLPLPAQRNKQNNHRGGVSNYDDDQYQQSLPSPGSDALGKELKKYNHNGGGNPSNNSKAQFNPFDETPVGGGGAGVGNGKVQYQSKFMRQYDEENNGAVSNHNKPGMNHNTNQISRNASNNDYENGYGNQHQKPQKNPKGSENPDDDFMQMLRSDGSKARGAGPGWNDDTTTNGFGAPPSGKKVVRKPVSESIIKTTSTPKGTKSTAGYSDMYNDNKLTQRSVSQPSSDDYGHGYSQQPKISPRTAPSNLYLTQGSMNQPPGNATQVSPRDPMVTAARSSLSLLKSKIKQTESFNSSMKSMTKKSSNNDFANDYDNNSVHSAGRGSYGNQNQSNQYSSRSDPYHTSRSQNGYEDDDYQRGAAPNKFRSSSSGGYEPSAPKNNNGRGAPLSTQANTRNSSNKYNQYQPQQQEDSDEEENVVVMVPKNRSNPQNNTFNNNPNKYSNPNQSRNAPVYQEQEQQRAPPGQQKRPPANQNRYEEDEEEYPPSYNNRGAAKLSNNPFSSPILDDDAMGEGEVPTEECPDCGRKFIPSAFAKHVKICAKVFMQKRKKFDSTKQRLQGEGVDPELKKVYEKSKKQEMKAQKMGAAPKKHEEQPVGGAGGGESKWKQQSSAFREAMKAAREYAKAKERGEEPPPPMISAPDPSLIPCPNCGRRFNEMAANRHIPQCKNIKAKPTVLKRGGGINAAGGASRVKK